MPTTPMPPVEGSETYMSRSELFGFRTDIDGGSWAAWGRELRSGA
jgi:hypothetical protein